MTSVWTSTRKPARDARKIPSPRIQSQISSKSVEGRAPRVPLSRCVREGHHPQQWKWDSWNSSLQYDCTGLRRSFPVAQTPQPLFNQTVTNGNQDGRTSKFQTRAPHYGLRRQSAAATALSRARCTRISSTRPARPAVHAPFPPCTLSPHRSLMRSPCAWALPLSTNPRLRPYSLPECR
jgi:hypothetical protein